MKRTILVVDDDFDEFELLREVLYEIDQKFDCHYALNGRQALSILENGEISTPEMILLDINMPVMNGWEFLKNVKSSPLFKEIPVVVYTTSNQDKDRSMAFMLGAYHYVRKPEDFESLKKELASLILKIQRIFLYLMKNLSITIKPFPGEWAQ